MKKSWQAVCIFSVAAIALVVLLIVTAGCGYIRFGEKDNMPVGSLNLSVTEPMSPLVLLPGGDNTVSYYTVTLSPLSLPDCSERGKYSVRCV